MLFALIWACVACASAVDRTKIAGEKGRDVVLAVVSQVKKCKIFLPDYDYFRRVAYVESRDGEDINTYRKSYNGGIWQVDLAGFDDTKAIRSHPSLNTKYEQIEDCLGISWPNVKWEDLRKPLYSGLAARLLMSNKPSSIPNTIAKQAPYYKATYNVNGAATPQDYIDRVRRLEGPEAQVCAVSREIVVVLDSSGSIGATNFAATLQLVSSAFPYANMTSTSLGLMEFSPPSVVIPLAIYDPSLWALKVAQTKYLASNTKIGAAISSAINVFSGNGQKIMLVMTDGESEDDVAVPANQARSVGITVVAFGIGSAIRMSELEVIAGGDTGVVTGTYDDLQSALAQISQAACIPQKFNMTTAKPISQSVVLPPNGKFFGMLTPPEQGQTLSYHTMHGTVDAYGCWGDCMPSAAVYDVAIQSSGTFLKPSQPNQQFLFAVSSGSTSSEIKLSVNFGSLPTPIASGGSLEVIVIVVTFGSIFAVFGLVACCCWVVLPKCDKQSVGVDLSDSSSIEVHPLDKSSL